MHSKYLEATTLSIPLVALAIFIWTVVTVQIHSYGRYDILGLASKLPIPYWVGLLLAVAFTLYVAGKVVDGKLYHLLWLLGSFLIILYLFGVPTLVQDYSGPLTVDSWAFISAPISIMSTGGLQIGSAPYTDFPSTFILGAIFMSVTDLPFLTVLKYHALIYSLVVLLLNYIVLRPLLRSPNLEYAIIFLTVGQVWVLQKWFSPAAMGYILYLTIFALLLRKQGKSRFLAMLPLVGLAITHPLSFFTLLVSLFLFMIFSCLVKKEVKFSMTFFLFSLVVWFTWLMFTASQTFNVNIGIFVGNLIRNILYGNPQGILTERVSTSIVTEAHSISSFLKIAYTLIHFSIGALGLVLAVLKRARHLSFSLIWLLPAVILFVMTSFALGQFAVYERVILYGSLPIALLAVYGFQGRLKPLCIMILIVSSMLAVHATYVNEYPEQVSQLEVRGTEFMILHGATYRSDTYPLPYLSLSNLYRENVEKPMEVFVYNSRIRNALFYWTGGDKYASSFDKMNFVYTNGDFSLSFS
ncbi:MAG: hypothetical protein H3Z53_08665 [archaeon]|nr:hypothetical protein [archaeon]MCP8314424.1 hypothetical protein [archaeon]MCP8319370.1 hypothetical protein [archaeon]